jgi:FADH2 O2-dependent halogenase
VSRVLPALRRPYDVAILGSGIVGTLLGAILARNGARVVLLDVATHPRFAIGESTTPHFIQAMRLLAHRYRVPEILALTDVRRSIRVVGTTFGVMRHFGFLLQRDGEESDPAAVYQFVPPRRLGSGPHLFRQDSDTYMFRVAARYGCDTRQGWRVADIDIDESGVTLVSETDELYRARFLVDASGSRSPLAERLRLRENPCRFGHRSRSVFTHMIGVRRLDDVLDHPRSARPPVPWHEGTVHHLFDRGWLWIIPFDNHARSGNPLCSVGLTVDPRHYPARDDVAPDEEFRRQVARFPAVARQLADARPVREWVSTPSLQYSSVRSIGYRWCLMSHAAGFVDPLFSLGLSNSAEVINALSWRLLAALRDDDFSVERFDYVERLERGLLNYNDELVSAAFVAFAHRELWDAVFRVWTLGLVPGAIRLATAALRARRTGLSTMDDLERAPYPGLDWPDHAGYAQLFGMMVELCTKCDIGEIGPDQAARQLGAAIQRAPFVPPVAWKEPGRRYFAPHPADLARLLVWAGVQAPGEIGRYGTGLARAAARTVWPLPRR